MAARWSRNGRWLLFDRLDPSQSNDIREVRLDEPTQAEVVVAGATMERWAQFSPDAGRPPPSPAPHRSRRWPSCPAWCSRLGSRSSWCRRRSSRGERVALHRRLGMPGAMLALVMVLVGIRTAVTAAARGSAPPGVDPLVFLAVPLFDMLCFAGFVTAAVWLRARKEAHSVRCWPWVCR